MLSYRHAFHAGNHADVLKHWVLVQCLQYLKRKDKPFLYLDTHAGAGLYPLCNEVANRTGEHRRGIGRLWSATAPPQFADYLSVVRRFNPDDLTRYPGSAVIAASLLRGEDRLCAVELQTDDRDLLTQHLSGRKNLQVVAGDGFQQVKAQLPPISRRGLVLIDPPYEMTEDYSRVVQAVRDGLRRFASGIYLVWYPLLNNPRARQLPGRLRAISGLRWLDVSLQVQAKPPGYGMYGSGMFVVNPPYLLRQDIQQAMPWLASQLADDESAGFELAVSESL